VPARSGRHVIYAEWGRTPPTLERFHGCIDARVLGQSAAPSSRQHRAQPERRHVHRGRHDDAHRHRLTGSNLTYNWSVNAPNNSPYTITNPMSATATLNMVAPAAAQDVTVSLLVTSGNASDTETRQFLHQPVANTQWQDLGALTAVPLTLVVGDRVNVRTVSSTGQDAFWPPTPITITSSNTASTQWPLTLGNAVNAMNGNVRVGVLNTSNNTITPAANATSNRVFSMTSANIQSAFLQVVPGNVPPAPTVSERLRAMRRCR
jgi:chitin-binding protein